MSILDTDTTRVRPSPEAAEEAVERAQTHGVALVDLQFSDIAGGIKGLTIPVTLLRHTLEHGYRFDGSALAGGMRLVELDLYLVPDPATLTILPNREGQPRRAQVFCWVLRRDGQPFPGDPRATLDRVLGQAANSGFDYQVGVELEFYLLGGNPADLTLLPAHDAAGYFDVGEEVLAGTRDEILATLHDMGINVGGAHHETGPGQQELDLLHAGGIRVADQIITTRQVIRTVAQRRGLRATFMAKPFADAPGSGMHVFQRLAGLDGGDDVLRDPATLDLSTTARHLIAGQLAHASGLCAVLCTTVNSYKRLAAGHRAPRHATWARVSQGSLIRVPAAAPGVETDVELRSPDAMVNPYLAIAAILSAALDGIRQGDEPPGPLDENLVTYDEDELRRIGAPQLPTSLGEALDAFARDDVMRAALGNYIFEQLLTVKRAEWIEYRRHVSPWEHLRYGDV
ncbi:MAG: glutamine synthetase [Chloroflexia bacterium]|nr:glutamine synthetase [Chloroflexia bacterium]